jgi:AbrB family looped-hinge helix DNA binding protein
MLQSLALEAPFCPQELGPEIGSNPAGGIDPLGIPLSMAEKVGDQTRVSSKHQVTIPARVFHAAGFAPGDMLQVEAEGAGRVVLTRIDELVDRYSGCLETGGELRDRVEGLRCG